MKSVFEKIAHGFLFGIGLSLVLGVATYVMTIQAQKSMEESYSEFSMPESELGTIEIVEHRELERNGKLIILGAVKNTGEQANSSITIMVDLYQKGVFVKQCEEYINGSLTADATRNFEISCGGGCSNDPVIEHDSYKIYVTGF